MRQFKDFKGYLFDVKGRCFSEYSGKYLKSWVGTTGYVFYKLAAYKKNVALHIVLMEMFGPEKPSPKHIVNHKNGIKTDFTLSNLEWVTTKRNIEHAYETGLRKWSGEVMFLVDDKEYIFGSLESAIVKFGLETPQNRLRFWANGIITDNILGKRLTDEISWDDLRRGKRETYVIRRDEAYEIFNIFTEEIIEFPSRSAIRRFIRGDTNAINKRLDLGYNYPLKEWAMRRKGDESVVFKKWDKEELYAHPLRGNIRPFWVTTPEGDRSLHRSITEIKDIYFPDLTGQAALQRAIVSKGKYRNHYFEPLRMSQPMQ